MRCGRAGMSIYAHIPTSRQRIRTCEGVCPGGRERCLEGPVPGLLLEDCRRYPCDLTFLDGEDGLSRSVSAYTTSPQMRFIQRTAATPKVSLSSMYFAAPWYAAAPTPSIAKDSDTNERGSVYGLSTSRQPHPVIAAVSHIRATHKLYWHGCGALSPRAFLSVSTWVTSCMLICAKRARTQSGKPAARNASASYVASAPV